MHQSHLQCLRRFSVFMGDQLFWRGCWGVFSCALPWPFLVLELHTMRQLAVLDEGLPDVEGDLADTAGLVGLVLDVGAGRPPRLQVWLRGSGDRLLHGLHWLLLWHQKKISSN